MLNLHLNLQLIHNFLNICFYFAYYGKTQVRHTHKLRKRVQSLGTFESSISQYYLKSSSRTMQNESELSLPKPPRCILYLNILFQQALLLT